MNAFIKDLKNDHQELLKLLLDVQKLGLANDAGRKKLLEGKRMLSAHLQKEDTKLYPNLVKDEAAKNVSEQFAGEMKKITEDLLAFMGKIEKSEINLEYGRELGRIISTLKMRINREEIQLYPLYEKLNA